MGVEIEKKFLVKNNSWRRGEGIHIRQGYLLNKEDGIVRIRVAGNKAFLSVKGATLGISRLEFEYGIPVDDAKEILNELCEKPIIEKIRYKLLTGNIKWEIDEFLKENAGLVVAEIELVNENQEFPKPDWLGEEVSSDIRYLNGNLVKNPYCNWK